MTAASRIELFIDVLDQPKQRALALPGLLPQQLVAAILQEFRGLGYLSAAPGDYRLQRAADGSALQEALQLGQQVKTGDRLLLVPHEAQPPVGTQRMAKQAVLRDEASGETYVLRWSPAIIGRPDAGLENNEQIAVDLAAHPRGLRVSRRHAQIAEENGSYVIQSLSQNPTTIRDPQGASTTLGADKQLLRSGQIVYLDAGDIALRFLVRDSEGTQLG